jgi:hypothetical protein
MPCSWSRRGERRLDEAGGGVGLGFLPDAGEGHRREDVVARVTIARVAVASAIRPAVEVAGEPFADAYLLGRLGPGGAGDLLDEGDGRAVPPCLREAGTPGRPRGAGGDHAGGHESQ